MFSSVCEEINTAVFKLDEDTVILLCHIFTVFIPRDLISLHTLAQEIDCSVCVWVSFCLRQASCTLHRRGDSVGATRVWQVTAQCAADSNGLHASMCRERFQIHDDTTTHLHTRVQTDRHTCVNAHTATYTYTEYTRAQVCCLSHQRWQHVRQPVVGTAVRLLSVCETLSSLLLSHRKPSCPTASILRWRQSKRVFLTHCTD